MKNTIIFSTEESSYFARLLASRLGVQVGTVERKTFGDPVFGERYYRIGIENHGDLFGKDVIFVGSAHTDQDFLELYRVGCALAGYGARRRIFVIPFMGYTTMERAVLPGEVVTVKPNIRMLSSIPNTELGNTFLMMDLHVSGLVHYFEGDCLRAELYGESVLVKAIAKLGLSNFMFGSADLGRPKWVKSFAKHFGVPEIAVVDKDRGFDQVEVYRVIGDVVGKQIVIYDDMIRSAQTLFKAAQAYLDKGAESIYAVTSHLALNTPDVGTALIQSPIRKIITTNSHPASHGALVAASEKFVVEDASGVFADKISRILK